MRNRFLRGVMPALALAALAALPAVSSAGVFVGVSVNIAPPPLPVYVQPPCPEAGYLWVPGYWAWEDGAYYWVPGTWVLPPQVGFLWTPGYWGWGDGVYVWHDGYWGPHVGFYGGVHYGFGYDGDGFAGGYWHRSVFFYNRAVMHVGPRFVTNVYYHPVVYHNTYQHVSFNGGPGGVVARPTREQMVAAHEHHFALTAPQQRQRRMAFADRSLRADYNHGRPPIAATARPAVFHGQGVLAARAAGGPVHLSPAHPAPHMAAPHMAAPHVRSDRPSWAAGQPHAGRQERIQPHAHAQSSFQEHTRPQSNFNLQQRARPQGNFQEHSYRPMQRPQARPQPQYHQQFRPEERAPMMHSAPPMRGGPQMHGAPHEQPRGGGRPQGGPPHEDRRGGGRGR